MLDDILADGLKVVFVGMAAGKVSARKHEYYGNKGNRFWEMLYSVGLTTRRYESKEFRDLPELGFGLTDLCKTQAGMDRMIPDSEVDVETFDQKILARKPRVVAFNGKRPGLIWLRYYSLKWPGYGMIPSRPPEFPEIFVLPSTSASNGHWDVEPWKQLSRFLK